MDVEGVGGGGCAEIRAALPKVAKAAQPSCAKGLAVVKGCTSSHSEKAASYIFNSDP